MLLILWHLISLFLKTDHCKPTIKWVLTKKNCDTFAPPPPQFQSFPSQEQKRLGFWLVLRVLIPSLVVISVPADMNPKVAAVWSGRINLSLSHVKHPVKARAPRSLIWKGLEGRKINGRSSSNTDLCFISGSASAFLFRRIFDGKGLVKLIFKWLKIPSYIKFVIVTLWEKPLDWVWALKLNPD